MGFHPEGLDRTSARFTTASNKHAHVRHGARSARYWSTTASTASGWCQFGTPAELPNINNSKAYHTELVELPDWRIGCIFTGKGHRRRGVARAAVAGGALRDQRRPAAGWWRPTQNRLRSREPQRGAYFHTGPESLFEEFGFTRDRRIAKWRWVMRLSP